MDRIILIGGAPTVGKSYFAREIARKLKLPWISTDTIRGQMKEIVRQKDYPNLFRFTDTNKDVVKHFELNSPQQIVDNQNMESLDVWKGIKALIDTDYEWESFIVEGIAIIPSLVKSLKTSKKIIPIFLVDDNPERIRKDIFVRGLWDDPEKYPDSIKEKEVEWVLKFNGYIIRECNKYGFETFKVERDGDFVKKIIEYINKK